MIGWRIRTGIWYADFWTGTIELFSVDGFSLEGVMAAKALRVRRSLESLQDDYVGGKKKPLEDLMRAWKGIKDLPPDDLRSFFVLGGYHGEPFRGAGRTSSSFWGGYCHHGNILFPTWHRAYLQQLEEALRSIPGCEEVTLPFWDETSESSLKKGIPWALTVEEFELDGIKTPNPLRSFKLPQSINDQISTIDANNAANYSKPSGYETVRYPLSGLVGTPADQAATDAHNAKYPHAAKNVEILNRNIVNWLTTSVVVDGIQVANHVEAQYKASLDAPNYTVFSNTTSRDQWNLTHAGSGGRVQSLESPHNSIHLAVGGCDVPTQHTSLIADANGDMGENDTAALDPIFHFHHCFVDRLFWLWQRKHGCTDALEVIPEYPGTNSIDGQPPTPGIAPNEWLTMDSPLYPFRMDETSGKQRFYTSRDCVNVETQMGYTYGPGSLEEPVQPALTKSHPALRGKVVQVSGINRARIRGSFVISAYATVRNEKVHLGTEAILSRWNVQGCANCQTHLEARAFIGLHDLPEEYHNSIEVEVHTRDGVMNQPHPVAAALRKPFRFEVR